MYELQGRWGFGVGLSLLGSFFMQFYGISGLLFFFTLLPSAFAEPSANLTFSTDHSTQTVALTSHLDKITYVPRDIQTTCSDQIDDGEEEQCDWVLEGVTHNEYTCDTPTTCGYHDVTRQEMVKKCKQVPHYRYEDHPCTQTVNDPVDQGLEYEITGDVLVVFDNKASGIVPNESIQISLDGENVIVKGLQSSGRLLTVKLDEDKTVTILRAPTADAPGLKNVQATIYVAGAPVDDIYSLIHPSVINAKRDPKTLEISMELEGMPSCFGARAVGEIELARPDYETVEISEFEVSARFRRENGKNLLTYSPLFDSSKQNFQIIEVGVPYTLTLWFTYDYWGAASCVLNPTNFADSWSGRAAHDVPFILEN